MSKIIRITPEKISTLATDEIFVFGSNLAGKHLGGAARAALKWGAVMGQGIGLQGQTYAIPTMFSTVDEIKPYVESFIAFAKNHPDLRFLVTKIGCGIAGFSEKEIAGLFTTVIREDIPNICLPEEFTGIIRSAEGIRNE